MNELPAGTTASQDGGPVAPVLRYLARAAELAPPPGGADRARRLAANRQATRAGAVGLVVAAAVVAPVTVAVAPDAVEAGPASLSRAAAEPFAPDPVPAVPTPADRDVPPATGGSPGGASSAAATHEATTAPTPGLPEPLDALVTGADGARYGGVLLDFRQQVYAVPAGAITSGVDTWPVSPCGTTERATDAERTGWFGQGVAAGGETARYAVASYQDAATAEAAAAELAAELERCAEPTAALTPPGVAWRWSRSPGGDLGGHWRDVGRGDPDPAPGPAPDPAPDPAPATAATAVGSPTATVEPAYPFQEGAQFAVAVDGAVVAAVVVGSPTAGTELGRSVGDVRPEVGPEPEPGSDLALAATADRVRVLSQALAEDAARHRDADAG